MRIFGHLIRDKTIILWPHHTEQNCARRCQSIAGCGERYFFTSVGVSSVISLGDLVMQYAELIRF